MKMDIAMMSVLCIGTSNGRNAYNVFALVTVDVFTNDRRPF